MLLKLGGVTFYTVGDEPFSTLYRVDAIEALCLAAYTSLGWSFSTLYRVDAIEAKSSQTAPDLMPNFQYPLSGRCY